jgi:hypothetical protein
MRRVSVLSAVALLGALSVVGTPAHAQREQARKGFWFNAGAGYGSLGCSGCASRSGSYSGGLSLGATMSPQLLLGVGTAGWTKSQLGASMTVAMLDARVRFYPAARGGFFLTGGLGYGSVSVGSAALGGLSVTSTGVGFLGGVGYDFRMAPNVSLTPYWNLFFVSANGGTSNVGQLGLSVTVH